MRIYITMSEGAICPNCGEQLGHHTDFFSGITFYCTSCNSKYPVRRIGEIYEVIEEND